MPDGARWYAYTDREVGWYDDEHTAAAAVVDEHNTGRGRPGGTDDEHRNG